MDIPLDEVIFFDAITSTPATGAAVDADSAPTFAVYEEATDTDIGVGGSMTKRTSLTGNYRGTFTVSAANGFEVGKWYSIIASGVVGGVTGKAVLRNFRVIAAEAIAGKPKVDVDALLGTAWLTPATAGTPDVNAKQLGGSTQSATDLKDFADEGYDPSTNKVAGVVLADTATNLTNAPTSGDLTATMKTSVTTAATAATPTVTAGTVSDKTGYTLSGAGVTAVQSGLATQADINALNQSASRRIMLVTVPQYERPESGTNSYTIECRTFDGDGAAVNADSDPTLTATGIVSGSLTANLSAISNPATGVYRWTYSETSDAALEQIRLDVSATVSGSTFTLSTYTQSADFIAATWTTTDAANLTAIFNKLPSRPFFTGTTSSSGAPLATDPVILTSAYDAAKTAATQTSVDDLPTNAELATALAAADDAVLAQIALVKSQTDNLPSDPADQSLIIAATDAVMSRLGAPVGASMSADIAGVKTDTGNLVSRITSTLFSGITSLAQWLGLMAGKQIGNSTARTELRATGAGSGTFDETTDSEEAIRDRGDAAWTTGGGGSAPTVEEIDEQLSATHGVGSWLTGGGGSGEHDVAVLVHLPGGVPAQNADVTLSMNGIPYSGKTGVDGVAHITPTPGNGAYSLRITATGFKFTPTTVNVNGDTSSGPHVLTALSLLVSSVDRVTGYGICEEEGQPLANVTVTLRQRRPAGTGRIFSAVPREAVSDETGLYQFTELYPGAGFLLNAGGEDVLVNIPADATGSIELKSAMMGDVSD